jgi:uncharacterized protein YraI
MAVTFSLGGAGHALAAKSPAVYADGDTESDSTGVTGVVKTGKLNVRSGPGAGYSIVAVLNQGDKVTLLGRTKGGAWLKLRTADDVEGWASSLYLTSDTLFIELPILEVAAQPTGVIIAGTANFRTGPSLTADIIMTLKQGTVVGIIGKSADGKWLKVSYNGLEGWVGLGTIVSSVPVSSLPVVTGETSGTGGGTGGSSGGSSGGSGAGTIKGFVIPDEGSFMSPLAIYAVSTTGGKTVGLAWSDDCARGINCPNGWPGKFEYVMTGVPAGTYVVYAFYATSDGGFAGGWTNNPQCGKSGSLQDHTLLSVKVGAGQTVSNVNICDFWSSNESTTPPWPSQ